LPCLLGGSAFAQSAQNEPPSIVAQGDAMLMKAADRAWVQIGAEGHASKPADAQRIAAEAMTAVQATLKQLGFGADVIRTTGYSLQPEYDYANGRQTLRDFVARNQIEVRVDDLKRLPEILDGAGASGAASVAGLRFDLKDRTTSELEALRAAVKDATARAEAIASGAGRSLGPIIRLQEQRMSTPGPVFGPQPMAAAGMAKVATPIEAGEIQVTAQVTLTVAIK
jgi:uncharacterized protein YggE